MLNEPPALMDPFPQADYPELSSNPVEDEIMKSLPQPSVYRGVADFCQRFGLTPTGLSGDIQDFDKFSIQDWDVVKPTFSLYLKLKLDIKNECNFVKFTEDYY